jgi:hypothetical protein
MQPNLVEKRRLQTPMLRSWIRHEALPQHIPMQLQVRVGADERKM